MGRMSRPGIQTGKATVESILGVGITRGLETEERKIVLCEGEVRGDGRPGEDSKLLRMAIGESEWEIHNCGSRVQTLKVFDELNRSYEWGDIFTVVDKDESTLKKLRERNNRGERLLIWPEARDLECFLLRSRRSIGRLD